MNIQTTINYVSESISLLLHMGKQKTYEKQIADAARSLPPDSASSFPPENYPVFFEKIEKQFRQEFKADWDEFLYYFAPISDGDHWDCLGRLLLLWEEFNHPELISFEDFSSGLLTMESEAYYKYFAVTLQGFDDTLRDSTQFEDLQEPEEILAYILKLDYPMEICLKIEDGMIHHKKHLSRLLRFISRTISLIRPYEKEMLGFVQRLKTYWASRVGDRDFLEYMCETSDTFQKLPENPLGYIVIPEIFSPFQVGISIDLDDKTNLFRAPYILSMGIFYFDAFASRYPENEPENKYTQGFYLEALKQLSDPKRFEILSYTKDTPAFGNELATHLELTTATVSHHICMLTQSKLIDYETKGTKIYYRSNKDTIRACFNYIKNEFRL